MCLPALSRADVFVNQAAPGCGTATGTAAKPFCTIAEAVNSAAPGDTIRIAPGSYLESLVLNQDVTLIGTGGDGATTLNAFGGSGVTIDTGVSVTIDGLTIRDGRGWAGGGILVSGDLVLRNSTVTENHVDSFYPQTTPRSGGGGIATGDSNASVTIRNCAVTNNSAGSAVGNETGGALLFTADQLTISGTTISGNTSQFTAGIVVVTNTVEISNTTISDNIGSYGGGAGINCASGTGLLSNLTITNNQTVFGAGGLSTIGVSMRNSIVADNYSFYPEQADIGSAPTSLGYNLIGVGNGGLANGVNGDQVGFIATPLAPLLGPLQDNGGRTETHALLAGSSALDAGDPVSFLPEDQRGLPRPSGTLADIGAFEHFDTLPDLCNGDGGDQMGCTACPCMNDAAPGTIGGCLNSAGSSARLIGSGSTSVSALPMSTNDLRFGLTGAPPKAFCILTSGDGVAPLNPMNPCFSLNSGLNSAFYDGLRCAVLNTRRHGGRVVDLGGEIGFTNNGWGGEDNPQVGLTHTFAPGQTRYWQAIMRDDATLSCMRGLNTSQAVEVVFSP